ncbi:lysoplasmalogenase family protein [Phenylobacterium sp.]|uniref:lysoplasmalogenase family protein n=1 Tax=Phenylobacterium sp. TaxID=1871053 RepID=UPI00391D62E6
MEPRHILARIVLAAAIAGGIGYVFTWDQPLAQWAHVAVKGSGVGLLALYAALLAKDRDGWLIALVLALGALGDVLLDAVGLQVGAVSFLAGHLVAIGLYLKNARAPLTVVRAAGALVFTGLVVALAWSLPDDRAAAPGIALYTTGLSLMAAAAWLSRFPRVLTGLGALMFLVSDLLIFARLGPLAGSELAGFGVWALYFTGQLMICLGVTRTLAEAGRRTA